MGRAVPGSSLASCNRYPMLSYLPSTGDGQLRAIQALSGLIQEQPLAQFIVMVTLKILRNHLACFLKYTEIVSERERKTLRSHSESYAELGVECD